MTEKEVYEKVKKKINKRLLSLILFDTISHERLVRLVNKVGIAYDGIRTSSLPGNELAGALSEEFFKYPEVGIEVIKALNRENAGSIQSVEKQSANRIDSLFRKDLIPEERMGSMLWALLVDKRAAVNKLALPLIREFREMDKGLERITREGRDLPPPSEEDEEEIEAADEIKAIFRDVQDSLSEAKRYFLKELSRKGKVDDRYRRIKEEISGLRASQDEGRKKFKSLQKEKDSLLKELEYHKSASYQPDRSREEALSHRINQLERENRKLAYDLEKSKEQGEKLKGLEQENLSLNKELGELKEDNLLLKEKLNEAGKKIQELRARPLLQEVEPQPKATPVFKEKGKRLGIFIDGQYAYSAIKAKYQRKLDYQKVLSITSGTRHLVKAICYLVKSHEATIQSFLGFLKNSGYEVRMKETEAEELESMNWSVGIALEVLSLVDSHGLDIVVLVSGRKDMLDLVNVLSRKKVRIEVIGCPGYTATELKERADEFIPIEEDMVI